MQKSRLTKSIGLPFGIALLLAGLFFLGGPAHSYKAQVVQTPTPDRLAKPTLPASPSQADLGAQVYWLSCLPCHGDKGQGLTEEFRTTYPPEEQYCWERGCHGENPYEAGFTLPMEIPALIGQGALTKFSDAAQFNSYIRATMPFWKPGLLTEEEAWQVTAFLLRQNGFWDESRELDESNASDVVVSRQAPTPVITPQQARAPNGGGANAWIILTGLVLLISVLLFVLKKSNITNMT